jgi:hypothetical protein
VKDPNRKFRFFREDEGVVVEEKTRYAPRKFTSERVYLTWDEVGRLASARLRYLYELDRAKTQAEAVSGKRRA